MVLLSENNETFIEIRTSKVALICNICCTFAPLGPTAFSKSLVSYLHVCVLSYFVFIFYFEQLFNASHRLLSALYCCLGLVGSRRSGLCHFQPLCVRATKWGKAWLSPYMSVLSNFDLLNVLAVSHDADFDVTCRTRSWGDCSKFLNRNSKLRGIFFVFLFLVGGRKFSIHVPSFSFQHFPKNLNTP